MSLQQARHAPRRRRGKGAPVPTGGARLLSAGSSVLVTFLLLSWMPGACTSAFVVPLPAAAPGSFCGGCGNKQVGGCDVLRVRECEVPVLLCSSVQHVEGSWGCKPTRIVCNLPSLILLLSYTAASSFCSW